MKQSRSIVIVAGAVSLATSLYAIGAAFSSESDDDGSADRAATTAAAGTAAAGTAVAEASETTAAAGATEAPAGGRVDIEIAGFAFNEGEPVTVPVGTEVVWTNMDSTAHTVQFPAGTGIPTSPELGQGDTYSVTFTEPGTYDYICGIHPATMKATLVVEG